jgi:hypothetical protein
MRFAIKSQTFTSKRCRFNVSNMEAWSYDWWKFLECRNGKVYLNMVSYSMQTGAQQRIVRDYLDEMKVKYKVVYVKAGLQSIGREINDLERSIDSILDDIANPRSHAKTNKARHRTIESIKNQIVRLRAYNKLTLSKRYVLNWEAREYLESIIKAKRVRKSEVNKKSVSEVDIVSEPVKRSLMVVQGERALSGESRARLTLINGGKHA